MKKTVLITVLISVLFLGGCFGFLRRDKDVKPAALENAKTGQVIVEPNSPQNSGDEAAVPSPPSFQDGDYYLQALATGNLETCGSIQNSKLKDRCEQEVKSRTQK